MDYSVNSIINDVYAADKSDELVTRLNILYNVLFEILVEQDAEQVYSEIISFEKKVAEDELRFISNYGRLTPELILSTYSTLSFETALMRRRSGNDIKLAEYEQKIYSQLLDMTQIINEEVKKSKARLISETLMDFAYASGRTDNMSFRLHNII